MGPNFGSFRPFAVGFRCLCKLREHWTSNAVAPCGLVASLALQAQYVDPGKALEAKERGNEQFRAGQWALAIDEYEEVSASLVTNIGLVLFNTVERFGGGGLCFLRDRVYVIAYVACVYVSTNVTMPCDGRGCYVMGRVFTTMHICRAELIPFNCTNCCL